MRYTKIVRKAAQSKLLDVVQTFNDDEFELWRHNMAIILNSLGKKNFLYVFGKSIYCLVNEYKTDVSFPKKSVEFIQLLYDAVLLSKKRKAIDVKLNRDVETEDLCLKVLNWKVILVDKGDWLLWEKIFVYLIFRYKF